MRKMERNETLCVKRGRRRWVEEEEKEEKGKDQGSDFDATLSQQ